MSSRTLLVLGLALQVYAAPVGEDGSALVPTVGNETQLMAADGGSWHYPVMLWSYCCGDSTFAAEFVTVLANNYGGVHTYPGGGGPELMKSEIKARFAAGAGLPKMAPPGTVITKMVKQANNKRSQLFFTGDFQMNPWGKAKFDLLSENNNPGLVKALQQAKVKVFTTYRNALDTLLCQVRDCMGEPDGVENSWAVPVDRWGKEFPFGSKASKCFNRRYSNEPVLVKIKNFNAVREHLKKDKVRLMNRQLKQHGLWAGMASPVEVLEGYEYEKQPGKLTEKAASAWYPLLKSVGMQYSWSSIKNAMKGLQKKLPKVRVDEPYSWRLYAGKAGDWDYRKKVEALVNEFGYRRWPGSNNTLIDWDDKPQKNGMKGSRHGIMPHSDFKGDDRDDGDMYAKFGDDESLWVEAP